MNNTLLYALGGSLCVGIAAQWLAARLKLPGILMLLLAGILAGPVTGWLHPNRDFGSVLQPIVSLSVALILFEGGLSLKMSELRGSGHLVVRLVGIGTVVTLALVTLAAWGLAGLSWRLALLIGGILVVTGPTVVGPLLNHVRPKDPAAAILRWEGIVIDPIGATLALSVYEITAVNPGTEPISAVLGGLLLTVLAGAVVGGLAAGLVYFLLRRHLVSDELQESVVLMLTLAAYLVSQALKGDAGLFTVTIMGIILANLPAINVKHIADFKENLRVLLLSFLFVNLAAGLRLESLTDQWGHNLLFLAALVLIIRPLAVVLSTLGTALTWPERWFMAWMAPRGIVAASVASVFGLRMAALHDPQADRIVPLIFIVIIGTVTIYGTTARWAGRKLAVLRPEPNGVMLAGAHPWAQQLALALQGAGVSVVLVDTNIEHIRQSRLQGLPVIYGSVLSDRLRDVLPNDIGHLLALTPNDEVNSLATLHWAAAFGRMNVYQLPRTQQSERMATEEAIHLHGRFCFADYTTLKDTDAVKATHLTETFGWNEFQAMHGSSALPLMLVTHGQVSVLALDVPAPPPPGSTLIYSKSPVPAEAAGPVAPDLLAPPALGNPGTAASLV